MELRRIEIRQPYLDPGRGIGARPDTEAVAVADVTDLSPEALALSDGQRPFARIGGGDCREQRQSTASRRNRDQNKVHTVVPFRGFE